MINAVRLRSAVVLTLCLAAAWPAVAAPRTLNLVVIDGDGAKSQPIEVSDVQISLSRNAPTGKPDDAQDPSTGPNQASVSLDSTTLANPVLLNWVSKGDGNASAQFTVTSSGQTTLYLLGNITSWTLSASHSSSSDGMAALALSARHLTVNGVTVN